MSQHTEAHITVRVAETTLTMSCNAGPGWVAATQVPGYRQEKDVDPESETETFVAAKLTIDDWRWSGVPFYVRTGKRLPKRATEIAIHFKQAVLL